jgi:hypothetical protein
MNDQTKEKTGRKGKPNLRLTSPNLWTSRSRARILGRAMLSELFWVCATWCYPVTCKVDFDLTNTGEGYRLKRPPQHHHLAQPTLAPIDPAQQFQP